MSSKSPKFVIQKHIKGRDVHWDLMLQVGETLETYRLELPPERVVYIGDIYSIDAVGARAGGLSPVIIDPTETYHGLDCPIIRGLLELLGPVDAGGS